MGIINQLITGGHHLVLMVQCPSNPRVSACRANFPSVFATATEMECSDEPWREIGERERRVRFWNTGTVIGRRPTWNSQFHCDIYIYTYLYTVYYMEYITNTNINQLNVVAGFSKGLQVVNYWLWGAMGCTSKWFFTLLEIQFVWWFQMRYVSSGC